MHTGAGGEAGDQNFQLALDHLDIAAIDGEGQRRFGEAHFHFRHARAGQVRIGVDVIDAIEQRSTGRGEGHRHFRRLQSHDAGF